MASEPETKLALKCEPCGTCGKLPVWTVGHHTAWWECPDGYCPSRGHLTGGFTFENATESWNATQEEGKREWIGICPFSQLKPKENYRDDRQAG
jgi:hypothetical protein